LEDSLNASVAKELPVRARSGAAEVSDDRGGELLEEVGSERAGIGAEGRLAHRRHSVRSAITDLGG
jgi:hypothetical protein